MYTFNIPTYFYLNDIPTYLPTYLRTYMKYMPTYKPTYLSTYGIPELTTSLLTHILIFLPYSYVNYLFTSIPTDLST